MDKTRNATYQAKLKVNTATRPIKEDDLAINEKVWPLHTPYE